MTETSNFKKWADANGFHGKQVGKAGEAIGLALTASSQRYTGKREPTKTELLAMAAVSAGLAPWCPEKQDQFSMVRGIVQSINGGANDKS